MLIPSGKSTVCSLSIWQTLQVPIDRRKFGSELHWIVLLSQWAKWCSQEIPQQRKTLFRWRGEHIGLAVSVLVTQCQLRFCIGNAYPFSETKPEWLFLKWPFLFLVWLKTTNQPTNQPTKIPKPTKTLPKPKNIIEYLLLFNDSWQYDQYTKNRIDLPQYRKFYFPRLKY